VPSLDQLVKDKRLLAFVGTGGVGKTTLSLAAAIEGARQGKRVAAITVDPSRRLTSLLGLDFESDQFTKRVEFSGVQSPLDIFYVDPQKVFQDYVSGKMSPEFFNKMQSNKIYQQISKNLRETHNFAALYQMQTILASGDYDLVILDTPPCHQVIDFFESPQRLQQFFSSQSSSGKKGWLQWVQERGMQVAETFLKTLVGKEFVEEMEGFFQAVGNLRLEIHVTTADFMKHLRSDDTSILLIFPPAKDKIQDAIYLQSEMSRNEYGISGFIMNRAFLQDLDFSEELALPTDSREKRLYNYYKTQKERSLQVLKDFEKESLEGSFFVTIPELSASMESLEDIDMFSQKVVKGWTPWTDL
jgi:anion-transporting  ArsA/GET3 family ATPase